MSDKKYLILPDLHYGLKNDSKIILKWQQKVLNQVMRQALRLDLKEVILLGDVFDRRESNSAFIVNEVSKIVSRLSSSFEKVYIIVGNHDMYYSSTRDVNWLSLNFKDRISNVVVVDEIMRFGNLVLCPWICSKKDMLDLQNEADIGGHLFGHLEINGYRMTASGVPCTKGIESSMLKKFDTIVSGHFHHKSDLYVGTLMPLTKDEYGGKYGFHTWSEESGLKFHQLNISMFDRINFENREYSYEELEQFRDKIVDVHVNGDVDYLESFVRKLSKVVYSKKIISDGKTIKVKREKRRVVVGSELEYIKKTHGELDIHETLSIYGDICEKARVAIREKR